MAIALRKAGDTAFQIFEKAHGPGGTWRDSRYPGCALFIIVRADSRLVAQLFASAQNMALHEGLRQQIRDHLPNALRCRGRAARATFVPISRWDETPDLAGNTVCVIGTGASAKIVPSIAGPGRGSRFLSGNGSAISKSTRILLSAALRAGDTLS